MAPPITSCNWASVNFFICLCLNSYQLLPDTVANANHCARHNAHGACGKTAQYAGASNTQAAANARPEGVTTTYDQFHLIHFDSFHFLHFTVK
jgi:hypothetical protein